MFSFLQKDKNKEENTISQYEIFHDESKEEAFWHIFLFVPTCNKKILVNELKETRKIVQKEDFSFKNINTGSMHGAKGFLLTLCSALQQKEGKTEPYIKYVGEKKNGQVCCFNGPLKVKIAIFKENHKHQKMKGHRDELSKIETTFRMGLQGASHFLFDKKNPLEICKIYLDGEEHYNIGYKRELDKKKIGEKLKSNAKEYISFNADFEILDGKFEEDNNILLELADIFLGTIRIQYLKNQKQLLSKNQKKKSKLYSHIKPIIDKINKGGVRMKNSRFEKCGTFTCAEIKDGERTFSELNLQLQSQPKPKPQSLF